MRQGTNVKRSWTNAEPVVQRWIIECDNEGIKLIQQRYADSHISKNQNLPYIISMSELKQLSPEQINKLRASFQLIDQDNDGKITLADLKGINESIGISVSETELEKMISMSTNEDGSVNFPAYLSIISSDIKSVPDPAELAQALEIFSRDMNIDIGELKNSLLKQGMKEGDIDSVIENFKMEKMNGDLIFKGKDFLEYLTK